jgi:spermidine synthase
MSPTRPPRETGRDIRANSRVDGPLAYARGVARWEKIGTARDPDGSELILYQDGSQFMIRADGRELMSSRAHASEEALAEITCRALESVPTPDVLVGGLGLGYTLGAALVHLPPGARVVVAEVVPAVVAWSRGPLGDLAGRPLDDERVRVEEVDVAAIIARRPASFDAIILDVDNGPEWLVRRANAALYGASGLARARRALRRPGVLSVWSADHDPRFTARLRRQGFAVEVHDVGARRSPGKPRHTIWIARVV